MLRNLGDASLWKNLPLFFGPESAKYLNQYIRLLAFSKPAVIELWISQLAALSLALDPSNNGGVINLRTSAGKTRVTELAILQILSSDPTAKVLYLAPFRSLAFEVERTLSASFSWLKFQVSHLYGGARVSAVDTELLVRSAITIATPEKARALLRSAPELFEKIKLIIIDEGHLIGPNERLVRNELFIDHLQAFARKSKARMLLLSAVLPNAEELAEWITGDSKSVAISLWKPSLERFGFLRWNGKRVRIDWVGKIESFNPSFITAKPLAKRKNSKLFPSNKTEAVAATAVRLSDIGPVMIFAGQAQAEWLSLILSDESRRRIPTPRFAPFALRDTSDINILYARTSSDGVVLCSLDGKTKIRVESTKNLPFEQMADDPRFVFEKIENIWHLIVRDPRCM
jgi:dipeptidyl aminopeptidase/acylaminoacyl peptidase